MAKPFAKLGEEMKKLIPPTVYFFIALHIVWVIRILMLKGTPLPTTSSISIAVAALVLGKAVLIADMLPMINRYPEKPLVFNIAWKTVIYLSVSIVVHYLERLVEAWRRAGGFEAANAKLAEEFVLPHFIAVQIVLLLLILIYTTTSEMARYLGRERLLHIFFGPLPAPPASIGKHAHNHSK